ncbi:hypothetical protein J4430_02795 [Candidatus Woesearchaeota archaeon]|nr:hypothetical protein [Candidatus Woesearchaeota archaeon]
MIVKTKEENYRLLQGGMFGNHLRMWDSFKEIVKSGYTGSVSIRYKGKGGGGEALYEVPFDKIWQRQEEIIKRGAEKDLITFNESAPDRRLTLQGELETSIRHYLLEYSTDKVGMREALGNFRKRAEGLKARMMLELFLTPSSYQDMMALIELFPDCIIEFSAYEICLGNIPGRNAVIWEVRDY